MDTGWRGKTIKAGSRSVHRAISYCFAEQTSLLDAFRKYLLNSSWLWSGRAGRGTHSPEGPVSPCPDVLAGTHPCQGSCTAMLSLGLLQGGKAEPCDSLALFQEEAVRKFLLFSFFTTKPPEGHCHSSHGRRVHPSCQPSEHH